MEQGKNAPSVAELWRSKRRRKGRLICERERDEEKRLMHGAERYKLKSRLKKTEKI